MMASNGIEGGMDTLKWWFSWKGSYPNVTWWTFEKTLLKQFQPGCNPDIPIWVQKEDMES